MSEMQYSTGPESTGPESASPDGAAPKRIAGYELRREIGRGALSVVYQAEDPRTGQEIALKLLALPASLSSEEASSLIASFGHEAQKMARLSHPHLVRFHETDPAQSRHFLVMEYLEGQTLRKQMGAGALKPQEALTILAQVAGALDTVHLAGMTHRGVKPAGVMLLPDGTAKLLEFGMAQSAEGEAGERPSGSQRGILVGSPPYMAPEQIKGEAGTAAADIWALGVLGYEMLTGRLPFTGPNTGGVMHQIMHQPPAPTPELPLAVQRALLRVLEKQPAKRYPAAGAFVQALKLAYSGQAPVTPERKPAASQQKPPMSQQKPVVSSRPPLPQWLPVASLLFLFLAGLGGALLLRPSFHPVQQASIGLTARVPSRPHPKLVPPPAVLVALPAVPAVKPNVPAVKPNVPAVKPNVPEAKPDVPAALTDVPPPTPAALPVPLQAPAVLEHHPAAPVKPALARTLTPAPVQPRRLAAAIKPVTLVQASHQSAPTPIPSRQVTVRVDSYPAQTVSRAVPTQEPVQPAPVQSASQTSSEQAVTLPADAGGYDPEADARLRKSAWDHNGVTAANGEVRK